MSRDFPVLMEHLTGKTGEVELDVPAPQGSGDGTARFERAQQAAIRRGDRVAHLHQLVDGHRASSNGAAEPAGLTTEVTENECRALIAAGATWIGPVEYRPVPRPHIERIRIRNYRCIQEIDFPLTPLHALIGPNDSGKSTILEAFVALPMGGLGSWNITVFWNGQDITNTAKATELSHPARLLRLDPETMRQPTKLIPNGQPLEYSPRGGGLAAVYDALLSRRLDAFLEISKRFTALFPTARSIQLTNSSESTKALGVELHDGRSVGAFQLSEGMLYWLAFAALPYLQPAPLLLIEEPENGLHPSRIADVMRVLRDISNTSQIIIATHSPLVVNELQPDEVTIITRTPERGTIATPLPKTKNFEQRSKVYALGELWLNYADGDLESDLVADSTIPSTAE
jgi:ABC-type branched-subunit amino acid transport system ATPase component